MDAVFDNGLRKDYGNSEIRYDYFNLDDQQIFRDHEPLIAPAPHCTDHDHFYYKEKKLSFTRQETCYYQGDFRENRLPLCGIHELSECDDKVKDHI